jgi:hypothetical protein
MATSPDLPGVVAAPTALADRALLNFSVGILAGVGLAKATTSTTRRRLIHFAAGRQHRRSPVI